MLMLSKPNRLVKTKDIQTVLARGRGFFNPYFNIKFYPKSNLPRFAVVVSTKVFKNATARNRLKRIIRETLRSKLSQVRPGDYVVIAKPKVGVLTGQDRMSQFLLLLNKLRWP